MSYRDMYSGWKADPEAFWMKASEAIDWVEKPERALFSEEAPFHHWFKDARLNTCWNALDRHVADGRGGTTALIHDSPVTGAKSRITYKELLDRVSRLAGALASSGVTAGDRVIIYMPMIPQAIEACLACARLGAVHSVVFGGFAAKELAVRINHCAPKCILAASCGIEPGRIVEYMPLLDAAIELSDHKPEFCVVFQRDESQAQLRPVRDHDWSEFVGTGQPADCVDVPGDHPAYILYTSGTTGQPKGVLRPTAGHAVALHWTMQNIYGVKPGEVFWAASDIGWVVGHSYICYAPLLAGNTSVIYEGKPVGTPDAGAFWRVVSEHRVAALFTAPTAFRAIKRADPKGSMLENYDLSCLRTLFLAGERADPDTIAWAEDQLKIPVIDHWWQTETGWAIAGNPVGVEMLPVKPGSPTVAMPGYDLRILDDSGEEVERGELGTIAVKLPLPPGCLSTLWRADDRYQDAYLSRFPGNYNTGDAGFMDDDGYVFIMARTDDVINVAGHRLSTGALEEALANHPDVAECAVIGARDELKGQLPVGLLCLNSGSERSHATIVKECIQLVRKEVGPVAAFKQAAVVDRLPKTRSGKILRATMVKIANGEDYTVPATIDDPEILGEVAEALETLGYPGPQSRA